MTNAQGNRQSTHDKLDYPNVVMVKDFKAVVVTILHEVKINTFDMNEKREVLSREIETIKYNI